MSQTPASPPAGLDELLDKLDHIAAGFILVRGYDGGVSEVVREIRRLRSAPAEQEVEEA